MNREQLVDSLKAGKSCKMHYHELDELLPSREDFLHAEFHKSFMRSLQKNMPILFMPNDIVEREMNGTYAIYMFGIMLDGSKACIQLTDIPVFFDIKMTAPEQDILQFLQVLHMVKHEIVENYPFEVFSPTPIKYVRAYFENLKERSAAIEAAIEANYTLAYDDDTKKRLSGEYFNKLSREYRFKTADWNRIEKYEIVTGFSSATCPIVLRVKVADFKKLNKAKRAAASSANALVKEHIDHDRTIIASWDIETYNKLGAEGLPDMKNPETWVLFCISVTLSWTYSVKPFLGVVISMFDVNYTNAQKAPPLTIVCRDEREVCLAFARVANAFKPEIWTAFNGSHFDWIAYVSKMHDDLVEIKRCFGSVYVSKSETPDNVRRFNMGSKDIKVSAELSITLDLVINFGGFIDTDAQAIMNQLYPKAEVIKNSSLNHYLKINELHSKVDMPYIMMFKIFEMCSASAPDEKRKILQAILSNKRYADIAKLPDDVTIDSAEKLLMGLVNYYCYVDSLSVHELLYKTSSISDRREIANLSHVQLYNAFYHANGQKVYNLVAGYAHKNRIAYSNRRGTLSDSERLRIGGGYVFPPQLGLNTREPIVGLDFASLYPSLIITYNLSNDKRVATKEEADRLREMGYTIHEIDMMCLDPEKREVPVRGWVVRHNTDINAPQKGAKPIKNYKKVITYGAPANKKIELDLLPDKIGIDAVETSCIYNVRWPAPPDVRGCARSVKYEIVRAERDALPNENLGLLGIIMIKMLGKRKPIKTQFLALKERAEKLHLEGLHDEAEALEFMKNKMDAKQKSIKVMSNSFYGCLTNHNSPIFNIVIGGGITKAGRDIIQRVHKFVMAGSYTVGMPKPLRGPVPHYGDTDSIYTPVSGHLLEPADREFEERVARGEDVVKARIDCWTKKVQITLAESKLLNEEINDYLIIETGCSQMSMSYEEVGFPSVFCGKKKYFFFQHFKQINFNPPFKDVFIRGIDSIKTGKNKVIQEIGKEFIMRALSPQNSASTTLLEIAEDLLRDFYIRDWDIESFVQMKTYKPKKKNVSVLNFYERMKEQYKKFEAEKNIEMMSLYKLPEAGEKFSFVKVIKPQLYSRVGNKIKQSTADIMEFVSVYEYYKTRGMQLDKNKYVTEVITILARFITYCPQFAPNFTAQEDNYTEYDKFIMESAKKHLMALCPKTGTSDVEEMKRIKKDIREKLKPVKDFIAAHNLSNVIGAFLTRTCDVSEFILKLRNEPANYISAATINAHIDKFMIKTKFDFVKLCKWMSLPKGPFIHERFTSIKTRLENDYAKIESLMRDLEPQFDDITVRALEEHLPQLQQFEALIREARALRQMQARYAAISTALNERKFKMI